MKSTALDRIYENLMNGGSYGCILKNVRYPVFHANLYYLDGCFCWHDYGSSAVGATKKDLTWLIETIFRTTPEEFEKTHLLLNEETRREIKKQVRRYELMNAHRDLVQSGKYRQAQMILRLLTRGRIHLYLDDDSYAVEMLCEKLGCYIRYSHDANTAIAHV